MSDNGGFWSFLKYFDKHSYGYDKKPHWEKSESSIDDPPSWIEEWEKEIEEEKELERKKARALIKESEEEKTSDAEIAHLKKQNELEELKQRLDKIEKENESLKKQIEAKPVLNSGSSFGALNTSGNSNSRLILALPPASSSRTEVVIYQSGENLSLEPYDRQQDFGRIFQSIHPERAFFFKAVTDVLEEHLKELKKAKVESYQMTIPLQFRDKNFYLAKFIRQFGDKDNIEIRMQDVFEYDYHSLMPQLKIENESELKEIPKDLRIKAFGNLLTMCERQGIDFLFDEIDLETLRCANAMEEKERTIPKIAKKLFLSVSTVMTRNKNIKRKAVNNLGSYPINDYKDVITFWEEQGMSFG